MVWYGPIFATVADLAPPQIRSTALAFMILLLNMLGTGSGAWITGLLGDAYSLELGLSSGAAVGLCAVVPLFFAARKYAAHREAAIAAS
jgi:predicted MFS family arabinose efflux permease